MFKKSGLKLAVLSLLATSTFGLPANTGVQASTTKHYTIALVNGDNTDPFFLTIWEGAASEAKKLGVTLTEVAPSQYDYTQQEPLLSDEIAKHVDGIVLSPDSETALDSTMAQAKTKGIPLVCVNAVKSLMNNTPNSLAFLGTNNYQLSQTGGKILAQLLHGKGTIAVVNSVAGSKGDHLRAIGVYDIVKKMYPEMKVLPMQYSDDDRTTAQSIATSLIESHPDLQGIFAVDSFTGQGVAAGVLAAGKAGKVKVVAIDAEPQEITLMKQGALQGVIAQQPYEMGVLAVQDIYEALTGHKRQINRSVILPAAPILTKDLNKPSVKTIIYSAYHG